MPAAFLSPISNDQVVDSNGSPLVGGYWQVFLAGTSTPVTTYTDSTGVTPQPTNITLDAAGRPANPIWLSGGIPVKFRLHSAAAVPLLTIDNVSGINDPANVTAQDQWVLYGAAPTYISGTSFSLVGDQTGIFQIGRRLKSSNSGGIRYSSITNSVYGAVTTVTVTNDSGTLDAGMSAVSYGLLSSVSSSVPTTIARSGVNTDITSLNAPALGAATATTQVAATSNTTVATTAFVQQEVPAASVTVAGKAELATTAETETGTDTGRVVTPAGLKGALLFSNGFESANQTVTPASTLSVAHGLAVVPKLFKVTLKCVTGEAGYSANDEISADFVFVSGVSVIRSSADATNVVISYDGASTQVPNKSTRAATTITSGNWAFIVRAWA
jgi:hypothetical protein